MASLTGNLVKDTYKALLKTSNNDVISGTEVQITDGVGGGTGVFIDTNGFLRASKVTITGGLSSQFLKADGTLDSTTYLDTTTTTSLIAEGSNLYFTYPRVLGTTLTGFLATAGNVTASDTILSAIEKIWYNLQTGGGGGGGYVPYNGATQDLDLGTYGLIADFVQLAGGTGNQGTLSWNTDEETADLILNGSTLQLGQEVLVHCRNNTGSTILNGTPVYVTGTLGASGRLTIAPMIADGSIDAKYFIGVTTEDINNGDDGKVCWFGKVRQFDTSIYSEGQILYVSETTAGEWQTTRPVSPNPDLEVAITINSKNNGTIFVRGNIGYQLSKNSDVYLNTIADNQGLIWDATNQRWENRDIVVSPYSIPVANNGYYEDSNITTDSSSVEITGDLNITGGDLTNDGDYYLLDAGAGINYIPIIQGLGQLLNSPFYVDGNDVGFNTTNPSNITGWNTIALNGTNGGLLEWKSGDVNKFHMYNNADKWIIESFLDSNDAIQMLYTNGYVGIGYGLSSTPAYRLDVNGDINIASGSVYRVNGSQISTSNVLEGTNLYYTQARFDTAFGLKTTTDLTEGTNLYYTDARARLSISESITGITYTPATGVFSLTAGYVIPTTTEQTNWTSAYNNMIVSAGVSGTTTKTLTLTQQDGGTITASWTDYDTGITGSLTSGYIPKATGTTTLGNSLIYDNGTNIGIGTTSPQASLHIAGAIISNPSGSGVMAGVQSNGYAIIHLNETNGGVIDFSTSGVDTKGRILYSNVDNYMFFGTNGSEKMRITSGGNVGIGTTAPSAKLEVQSSSSTGNEDIAFFSRPTYGTILKIARRAGSGEIGSPQNLYLTADYNNTQTSTNSNIIFETDTTERMRITSGGLVGIGTTSVYDKLTIYSTNSSIISMRDAGISATYGGYIKGYGVSGSGGYLDLGVIDNNTYRSAITIQAQTNAIIFKTASTSTERMRITSGGNVGIGTSSPSYKLDVAGDINITGNYKVNGVNIGSGISGLTTNYVPRATSSTALGNSPIFIYNGVDFYFNQTSSENSRFFINANGSVSGTTYDLFTIQRNDSGSTTTAFKIQEDGLTCLDTYGTYSPGQYTTSSGANLYYDYYAGGILRMSTSSRRYKTDIVDYTKGLAEVLNMRPRLYKGISDGDRIFAGLIAEEIHDIGLTEFVNYNKENQPNALEYSRMVAILINAIKELKAELDELKK